MLENLIDAAGNFEVALDLIQRAQDLIDKNLKGVKVCVVFMKRLDELKFKCTQKLESECLNQVDQWVNARILLMPSNQRSAEYKDKFTATVSSYFRPEVWSYLKPDDILNTWTFNFDLDDSAFFLRVSNFVNSLLRTEEMDQFLRAMKLFYANCTKKFYN